MASISERFAASLAREKPTRNRMSAGAAPILEQAAKLRRLQKIGFPMLGPYPFAQAT